MQYSEWMIPYFYISLFFFCFPLFCPTIFDGLFLTEHPEPCSHRSFVSRRNEGCDFKPWQWKPPSGLVCQKHDTWKQEAWQYGFFNRCVWSISELFFHLNSKSNSKSFNWNCSWWSGLSKIHADQQVGDIWTWRFFGFTILRSPTNLNQEVNKTEFLILLIFYFWQKSARLGPTHPESTSLMSFLFHSG